MALYTTILNYSKKRVWGKADYIQVAARCATVQRWRRDDSIMAVVRVIGVIVLRLNLNTMRLRDSAAMTFRRGLALTALWACR
jgi:hypothetical protein